MVAAMPRSIAKRRSASHSSSIAPIRPADDAAIEQAAHIVQRGGLVAFPTETVYGLGADAMNAKAVARLFAVKNRPRFDPLIVHVASQEAARRLWKHCPKMACVLMERFWPGPLTLVLPKQAIVPDLVTAGLPTAAIRMPDHPVALTLIRKAGCPIAAPSANRFGRISPTTAQAVASELRQSVDLILDGGPTRLGLESTVLGFDGDRVLLLRPGGLPVEEIERWLHRPVTIPRSHRPMASPGRLARHYMPTTAIYLIREETLRCDPSIRAKGKAIPWRRIGLLAWKPIALEPKGQPGQTEILSRHGDLKEAAAHFFSALRKLDEAGWDAIVALMPPSKGLGLAMQDRLERAAAGWVVGSRLRANLPYAIVQPQKTQTKDRPLTPCKTGR